MQKLNNRERSVLEYIRRVTLEKGYAPSVRDIGAALGLKSTSTVQMYLDRLCSYGYIRREEGKSRSIALCEQRQLRSIPILCDGVRSVDAVDEASFEGSLDFCYCGGGYEDAVLFAARIEDDTYAVIAHGALPTEGGRVAVMTAEGVRVRRADSIPSEHILGTVVAILEMI